MVLVQQLLGSAKRKQKFLLTPFLPPLPSCAWTLGLATLKVQAKGGCSWEDLKSYVYNIRK